MDLEPRKGPTTVLAVQGDELDDSGESAILDPHTGELEADPRVVRALEAYVAACERGARPNKERFLAKYPTIAPFLAECLESLECLRRAAPHFDACTPEETGPFVAGFKEVPPLTRLGDYRLVREIGRGGMGVVFEAEQLSLGRRVALKLLPFTAAIDPKQVQRFQVEVQAAAHLHHPHIVPIYSVGCESGVHYFAMQLVAGRSLGAIIGMLRDPSTGLADSWSRNGPSPIEAELLDDAARGGSEQDQWGGYFSAFARLGIQAAEALEHAHGLGVVHRDIKPANLLVDSSQHLWVADFGLARFQGDSGLTTTGDLVGTLKYMSPESAAGGARRGAVDHRTDLYSLGATLYELLTLRPAFQGRDLPTLVHQVCHEDPIPPRRIDPRIPRDLETIVLKAMAKEPANRYQRAREMACDLRRFTAGEPILVRRPSLAERALRWSRRHRGVVVSGGVALVLALVSLSISTVMIWAAMNRTAQVSQARALELNRAQANLELAHRALDLCLKTAESWFPRDSGDDAADGAMLKTALAFYEQIASQNAAPEVELRTFTAYSRVGDIRAALDDLRGAEDAYRKAMAIMVGMIERDPRNDRGLALLADVLEKFGALLRKQSIYGPAEWSIVEAVRLLKQADQQSPDDLDCRLSLARAINQMASLKGETGRIKPAIAESRRALDLLHSLDSRADPTRIDALTLKKDLASAYTNLGKWLQLDGSLGESEDVYRKALALLKELVTKAPGVPVTRESLALCQAMLGELLRSNRRNGEAEPLLKEAIYGLERLSADFPRVPRYKQHLARFYIVLSTLYRETNRFQDAALARRKATTWDPLLQCGQHVHLNNLAWYLVTAPNPAVRNPARGLEVALKAIKLVPESWASWNTLGVALFRNGDLSGARDAFLTSLEKKPGENAFDGFFLAMTLWRLGQKQAARGWLARAEEWRLRNLPDDVELLRFRAEAEQVIGPFPGHAPEPPPAMPLTVAEALKDPSFGFPKQCPSPDRGDTDGTQLGKRETCGKLPVPGAIRVQDFLDHALFFMDLT
jgi:serine/threonine protein kinase/tetratricopeptide (TPR) repeat protein